MALVPLLAPLLNALACIVNANSDRFMKTLVPAHRFEKVGSEGYHSLWRWYRDFEATQFPDPGGLRASLATFTLGAFHNPLPSTSLVICRAATQSVRLRSAACTTRLHPRAGACFGTYRYYPAVARAALLAVHTSWRLLLVVNVLFPRDRILLSILYRRLPGGGAGGDGGL